MSDPRIEDLESFQKLLADAGNMEKIKRAFPVLKPFLRLMGADVAALEKTLAEVEPLAKATREFITIPDRFNDLLGPRGWIMYEMLNIDIAKAAVELAEAGDLDGTETMLVEHYNEETLRFGINFMHAIKAFHPRLPLARKAMADYLERRYHASVPVVLALLDGTVNDISQKGFFSKDATFEAWNSIAAHSKGLSVLSKILGDSRTKTTTEPLTMPFRHGILHGMDLGYDNKLVAAKAWAALFSIRDWAIKVERGQTQKPPDPPKKTLREIAQQLKENAEEKKRISVWSPRHIKVGEEIPSSGDPEEYGEGTPEQKVVEFLHNWSKANYGRMALCLPHDEREHLNKAAGRLREYYKDKVLQQFELLQVTDNAAAVTAVQVRLLYEEDGNTVERIVDVRLLTEDSVGRPVARGKQGSSWGLLTANL